MRKHWLKVLKKGYLPISSEWENISKIPFTWILELSRSRHDENSRSRKTSYTKISSMLRKVLFLDVPSTVLIQKFWKLSVLNNFSTPNLTINFWFNHSWIFPQEGHSVATFVGRILSRSQFVPISIECDWILIMLRWLQELLLIDIISFSEISL